MAGCRIALVAIYRDGKRKARVSLDLIEFYELSPIEKHAGLRLGGSSPIGRANRHSTSNQPANAGVCDHAAVSTTLRNEGGNSTVAKNLFG